MNHTPKPTLQKPQSLLGWAVTYYISHPSLIGFSALAAAGVALKAGSVINTAPFLHLLLELSIDASRIGLILAIVGGGDFRKGYADTKHFLSSSEPGASDDDETFNDFWLNVRRRRRQILISFIVLVAAIYATNFAIATFTELMSRNYGIPVHAALRNLTIVPVTIVWIYGLWRSLQRR